VCTWRRVARRSQGFSTGCQWRWIAPAAGSVKAPGFVSGAGCPASRCSAPSFSSPRSAWGPHLPDAPRPQKSGLVPRRPVPRFLRRVQEAGSGLHGVHGLRGQRTARRPYPVSTSSISSMSSVPPTRQPRQRGPCGKSEPITRHGSRELDAPQWCLPRRASVWHSRPRLCCGGGGGPMHSRGRLLHTYSTCRECSGCPVSVIGGFGFGICFGFRASVFGFFQCPAVPHILYLPGVLWLPCLADWGVGFGICFGFRASVFGFPSARLCHTYLACREFSGSPVWLIGGSGVGICFGFRALVFGFPSVRLRHTYLICREELRDRRAGPLTLRASPSILGWGWERGKPC